MIIKNNFHVFAIIIFMFLCTNLSCGATEYYLATYNIRYNEPKDKIKGNDWDNRVEMLCNLVLFNDFDIWGIQEANDKQLQDIIKYVGNEYMYSGAFSDDGLKKGSINAILYKKNKFKLIASNTFWLSDTPEKVSKGWDARFYRTCNWVNLLDKENNNSIYFFNVHVDATGKLAKEKSCQLLVNQIKKICPNNKAVLVGDFNQYETDKPVKFISNSKILYDAYELAKYRWMPTGSFNNFNPLTVSNKRLDHIFVTNSFKVKSFGILNNCYLTVNDNNKCITNYKLTPYGAKNPQLHTLSDHYPLVTKVIL